MSGNNFSNNKILGGYYDPYNTSNDGIMKLNQQ